MNHGNSSSFRDSTNFGNNNSKAPDSSSGDICCDCGVSAIQLSTRKAGPNQNRPFYKCGSSTHSCNFFLWGDAPTNTTVVPRIDDSNQQVGQQFHQNNNPIDDDVKCKCNTLAVTRTVNKDGPNKGRQFYCCMKNRDEGCGFFQWTDENPQIGTSSTSNSFKTNSFNGFDNSFAQRGSNSFGSNNNAGSEDLSCACGNPAVVRTVNKDGPNKGRQFHVCTKPMDQKCNFFQWADEPGTTNNSSNNSFGNNSTFSRNNSFGNAKQNSFSAINSANSNDVCCNCGTVAKLCTVKKDGPNKGRQFYGCMKPREAGCQFFQWGDENNTNDTGTKSRKRKCGQCGETGHDKRSCPQNR